MQCAIVQVVGLVGGLHFTKECTDEDKHVQKSVLKNIVTLAKRLQKPIMLFCVEAERDMLQVCNAPFVLGLVPLFKQLPTMQVEKSCI